MIFMQMAADQLHKRSNTIDAVVREKVKKKKREAFNCDLMMRSNIFLEWDDKKNNVVSKREQIGLARRELVPFLDVVPYCHKSIADVFPVPHEIFELENLMNVLSYEAWQTLLSEKERRFLTRLLPKGAESQKVVKELLAGENFYFGNPFLEWGASLCSGDCHPDAVISREESSKANKKAYYSDLQSYHTNMIGNLQRWKERWVTCDDSELQFMQIMRSSKRCSEKSAFLQANESGVREPDENLGATSESCSWAAHDKACSSGSPNFTMMHEETQSWKGNKRSKCYDSSDGLQVIARSFKEENLHKRNVECGDGAKYMSYIKVSKEQHQRVKSSMKHSSSSIQPRSLNHVLGNLDTFCVQPYEVFEEEERHKLHDYWLQLVNRDIPAGFKNWKNWQLEKWELTQSLGREIQEKSTSLNEGDLGEKNCIMVPQAEDEPDLGPTVAVEDEEKEKPCSLRHESINDGETSHEPSSPSEDEENESADCLPRQQQQHGNQENDETTIEVEQEHGSAQGSAEDSNGLQHIHLVDSGFKFCPMDVDSDNSHLLVNKDDVTSSNLPAYPENLNNLDAQVGQGSTLPSSNEVWASAYYQNPTSVSHEFTSASDLSLGHPHQSGRGNSFFRPYTNQERNELLVQSLYKNPGTLPYHHDLGTGHYSLQEPSIPLELGQKGLNEIYMQQTVHESIYADAHSNASRYSIPRQHVTSPHDQVQEWTPQLNGGEILSQSWFSGEHRVDNSWPGLDGSRISNISCLEASRISNIPSLEGSRMSSIPSLDGSRISDLPNLVVSRISNLPNLEGSRISSVPGLGPSRMSNVASLEASRIPNHNIENGSIGGDQSLFSVLSQCTALRSSTPYDSMGTRTTERLLQSGNYSGVGGGGAVPMNNVLPQGTNSLNYLNGFDPTAGVRANGGGWISLPHQNNALQDPLGKAFLRSWNHH